MKKTLICLCNIVTFCISSAFAQQSNRLSVLEFTQDPLDLTAKNDQFKRLDDSGVLYSIIKVTSDKVDDDMESYRFDFGQSNSFVVNHAEMEELWVYVQKGAKTMTIRRDGYEPINKYDLQMTVDAGCTYLLRLCNSVPMANTQMVVFRVNPTKARATVKVKANRQDAPIEEVGTTDGAGIVAKNLPFGTYMYWVVSDIYHPMEGLFTLKNQQENHVEALTMRPNFGIITLTVDADAEIFVDGKNIGYRTWTGELKAGRHKVECIQKNHHSSTQNIVVSEGETRTIRLTPPTAITEETVKLCPDANHPHMIDMGDGVRWACCNVGAKSPSEYGLPYAWGETETKESFKHYNYKWGEPPTKYAVEDDSKEIKKTDGKTRLEAKDDAATANWGNKWRMPTSKEMTNLSLNCEWTLTTVDGVKGYIVTAENGNNIFLPMPGIYEDKEMAGEGLFGNYWTSDVYEKHCSFAITHNLSVDHTYKHQIPRYMGCNVRPVAK